MMLNTTKNPDLEIDLESAVLQGLAEDGGLYMPKQIPKLSNDFFEKIENLSFKEIAYEVSKVLLQGVIPDEELKLLIDDAVNFDAPLVEVGKNTYSLELFHGPTLAFKDFGARFMSRLIGYFLRNSDKKINVLVATSGDTGSAVAHGFLQVDNIDVTLLYPKAKVSPLQEKQLTTMGHNIRVLEIDGVFDDCQSMVKQAFNDTELKSLNLTSANSINIARLIPQTFYYLYAYAQIKKLKITKDIIFSIPSGNFGNLTAGLIAQKMGLPVYKFLAVTNANDTFPRFQSSGEYQANPSVHTISNAMDVGDPSNFPRILQLGLENVWSHSFSDAETMQIMKDVYEKTGYIMDPHGAVAYLGLQRYRQENPDHVEDTVCVFLETAHPAKFKESVEKAIGESVEIPERLAMYGDRIKESIALNNKYESLKVFLRQ